MKIPITDAKGRLADLVRHAEVGDEVILTRRGHAAVRLVPVAAKPTGRFRRALLEKVRAAGAIKASVGPGAARSQDFLYGDDGMPR